MTLTELRQELSSEVHLARLGLVLRQKIPGFTPTAYGYPKFTELLKACRDIGYLRFGTRPEDRCFLFKDSSTSLIYTVAKHIWKVCVNINPAVEAWLDLEDGRSVENNPEVVEAEPERYILVPRFARARQAQLLNTFVATLNAEIRPRIEALVDHWGASSDSYDDLLTKLSELDLRKPWFTFLQAAVETELREWAAEHGLSSSELFEAKPENLPPRVTNSDTGFDEENLRMFLKQAIDQMTLVELSQWSVPVRLLLKRN